MEPFVKILHFPRVLILFALLAAGCTTPSAPPASLAARLTPEWIAGAKRLHSGERTIYYRGRAHASVGSRESQWAGTVNGEILALDPRIAIVIPAGTLKLTPGGGMKISGPGHTTVASDTPVWKHLLVP
jgi:hypothetical protein